MDSINNAKTIHDILSVQQRISTMGETIQKAQRMENLVGASKPPLTVEIHESNDDGIIIEISSGPMFGFDDIDLDDVQQPPQSEEVMMVFEDEESSASQHSTFKPKAKKKKKIAVSRKEFLSLQAKVD